ncbi:lipoprotein [Spirochaetia bacterium]|nr:lipoprotein [Spirochaetia bacterium]
MKFPFILFALLPLFFSACSQDQAASIAREDLFTLDIGRLEDQLALYSLEGDRGITAVNIAMRDGLFYISDGKGQKIVQYTSYGDFIFMIFNEETNPTPLSLRTNIEDSAAATRWAFSWPLREPGHLAVDSRKHIYVEDRLPDDRYSVDAESRALLDSTVLHFDQDGRFVEYLGQEGIGGSPFPRITGIYTSIWDEIVVVCRIPSGWNIYWFDSTGMLLYLLPLKNSAVPVPPDWPKVSSSMDAIMPAPDSRTLYFKVDYYRDTFDESTNTRSGNESDSSIIWSMDVENGSYTDRIEVPFLEYTFNENGRKVSARVLYSMLGAIRGGRIFLNFPLESGYSILILNAGSAADAAAAEGGQRQGTIRVDRDELQLNTFDLSADGILSALLVSNYEAKLVWWRTDKILGAIAP